MFLTARFRERRERLPPSRGFHVAWKMFLLDNTAEAAAFGDVAPTPPRAHSFETQPLYFSTLAA